MKQDQRFIWLDLIRGLSATAVCASHLRNSMLSDFGDVQAPTILHKMFYLATGMGHEAVMVFFVLSGMFVGGSVLKSGQDFRFGDYYVARLSRLWVVLIPALFLTLLVDRIIAAQAPEALAGAYNATWNSGPNPAEGYSTSIWTFLGNVFFLQTISALVFGTNGPLWSLANEFWYYFIFPLLAVAFRRFGGWRIASRLLAAVMAAAILLLLTESIRLGFIVWLMGVGVYLVSNRMAAGYRPFLLVITSLLFATSLLYSKTDAWEGALGFHSDLAVGLGFSAFCIVVAKWPPPSPTPFGRALASFAEKISEYSYSLYLSHFPVVVLIAAVAYGGSKLQPNAEGLLLFVGWLALLLLLAMIFWFLFERHTAAVRRAVSERVNQLAGHRFDSTK